MLIDSELAYQNLQFENEIKLDDELMFRYNKHEQDAIFSQKPWNKDPNYFQNVKISTQALIKMLTHAKEGGNIEVMGIMQGKVIGRELIVVDAFALPVEGTETRVNAQSEGNEYLIEYLTNIKESGRLENAVGWYHSHPGYGCWLSGIDVTTQKLNQQFQDPFLAIVVDPLRSSSAGKVEIGAFRTYPAGYTPENQRETEFQAIPVEKIEDFGVHAGEYYPLSVEYFKSSQDEEIIAKLWDKYWMNTLSTSTVFSVIE
ncbi:putative COP9 signalosome, subunit CSN5 [Neoconidiobolus thromboides FSU 785]|nr:putative COP9 signalosome, subunit CSN5 [Neoconidiobolus thromboides FSU 785]